MQKCFQRAAAVGVLIIYLAGETKPKAVADVISAANRPRAILLGMIVTRVSQNTYADAYWYYVFYRFKNYKTGELYIQSKRNLILPGSVSGSEPHLLETVRENLSHSHHFFIPQDSIATLDLEAERDVLPPSNKGPI